MSDLPPPPSLHSEAALFLDFDGTLAPIQNDPDSVALPDGGAHQLTALSMELGGALATISGRDIRDLSQRLPLELWRAGGHGLEICAPGEAAPSTPPRSPVTLLSDIEDIVRDFPGARVEPKGAVIAVHYRAAPNIGPSLSDALFDLIQDVQGYTLQAGKMVLEAKPEGAHKGRAVERLMQQLPFAGRAPIVVGDDTTDEDAMAVAIRAGGFAVKIGSGDTFAQYRLPDPSAVWMWLEVPKP